MRLSREERRLLLQRRLQKAQADPHGLSEAAEFYGALMASLVEEEPAIELPELDAASLKAKLVSGQPILHGESLGVDAEAICALLVKLCVATEEAGQLSGDVNPKRLSWLQSYKAERKPAYARAIAAAQIRQALQAGTLDFDPVLDQLLRGHDDELASLATQAQLDPNLLVALGRFALRPTLMAYADAFESAVRAYDERWMRSVCPVCGGPPLLSEYRDADQSRHLRCAACGTAWLFRRLECPHCGSDQFRALSYIKLAADTMHQVDTCDVCQRYLKGVAASDATPSDLLPLEDLLTLHLDVAAQQKGYTR